MNKSNNVPIVSPKNTKDGLTKLQKQFNSKIKKIAQLKEQIVLLEVSVPKMVLLVNSELTPIRKEINECKIEVIKIFDKSYNLAGFTKKQKEKMADFISEESFELINEYRLRELIPFFDKYSGDTYEEVESRSMEESKEELKNMFGSMGMDINLDDWDFNNDEMMAQKMAEMKQIAEENFEQKRKEHEEKNAQKKKTVKQIAKEEALAMQEKASLKSIKEIYNQLVKEFHPDKEQDIEKKAQKTEIMKDITIAYEKQDLFSLLKLQLDLAQIGLENIAEMNDDKIKSFIQVLNEQTQELTSQLKMERTVVINTHKFDDLSMMVYDPESMEKIVKSQKKKLLDEKKEVESQLASFSNISNIKFFLKHYEIASNNPFNDLMSMLMNM